MSSASVFSGELAPPAIGSRVVPIPIAGAGSVEASSTGLVVTGFRGGSNARAILVFFAVLAIALPLEWALNRVLPLSRVSWLGAAIAAAILAAAVTPRKAKAAEPWRLEYPWSAVKSVTSEAQDATLLVITIRDGKPKGGIYFRPTAPVDEVRAALAGYLA